MKGGEAEVIRKGLDGRSEGESERERKSRRRRRRAVYLNVSRC